MDSQDRGPLVFQASKSINGEACIVSVYDSSMKKLHAFIVYNLVNESVLYLYICCLYFVVLRVTAVIREIR